MISVWILWKGKELIENLVHVASTWQAIYDECLKPVRLVFKSLSILYDTTNTNYSSSQV